MGKLKNSLQQQLENDPVFAEQYWQYQDQFPSEPELPQGNNGQLASIAIKPKHQSSRSSSLDEPPF